LRTWATGEFTSDTVTWADAAAAAPTASKVNTKNFAVGVNVLPFVFSV